jgi:transcriptional regulator GlxA family with amidase domain
VRLGAIGLEILVKLQEKARPPKIPRRIEDIVSRAQTQLSEIDANESTVEQMAANLGVGYSHFRRAFKCQTGFSPKQYHNEVRFRRTKELLSNTALSIKEIASQLGYSSPYHLTKDFTQRTKNAPSVWRTGLGKTIG